MSSVKFFSIVLASVICLVACNKATKTDCERYSMDNQYVTVAEVTDSVVKLPTTVNIEEWNIDSVGLLCRSRNTENVFYRFDFNSFDLIDSFGTIGQGPGEYVMPRILRSCSNHSIIVDCATGRFTGGNNSPSEDVLHSSNSVIGINGLTDIHYPVIGGYSLRGEDKIWYSINTQSESKVDSILFSRADISSTQAKVDFKLAGNGEYVVFVQQFVDEYMIAKINSSGKILSKALHVGNGESSTNKAYYVDVDCGKHYFIILSMRNVDFSQSEPEGYSCVDVRDYSGKAIAQIRLGFYPRKLLLDEAHNRILMLSAMDEDIHVVSLNDFLNK